MTWQELQLVEAAHEALRRNGYTLRCASYGDKHPLVDTPEGKRARVYIQVSSKANQPEGRHLYGISFGYFDTKELFVFFTGDEDTFLVVPTEVLRKVMRENHDNVKVRRTQWHTNIFFDWGGTHQLHPVCRSRVFTLEKVSLSQYALPVDGDAACV